MKKTVITIIGVLALGAVAAGVSNLLSPDAPLVSSQAHAGTLSQTFTIEKMTCASCPITVRKAMQRVDGVKSVSVDFESKTATARFDPDIADISAIAAASTNSGFPAHAKEPG